jgi:hypothetical protein
LRGWSNGEKSQVFIEVRERHVLFPFWASVRGDFGAALIRVEAPKFGWFCVIA